MVVAPDMVVSVSFRVLDGAGRHVDEAALEYVHGYAQVIPGLEAGLTGASVGEQRDLTLEPDEAFGERDPEALLEIDRHDFPDADGLCAGDEVVASAPDGAEAVHRVLEITDDAIVVDLNHPLAGERVRFVADVVGIRPATDAELDAAQAEADERIVSAGAIGYALAPPEELKSADLVQLRHRSGQEGRENHE